MTVGDNAREEAAGYGEICVADTFRVAHVCFVAVQTNFVEAAFPAWGEGVRSGLR